MNASRLVAVKGGVQRSFNAADLRFESKQTTSLTAANGNTVGSAAVVCVAARDVAGDAYESSQALLLESCLIIVRAARAPVLDRRSNRLIQVNSSSVTAEDSVVLDGCWTMNVDLGDWGDVETASSSGRVRGLGDAVCGDAREVGVVGAAGRLPLDMEASTASAIYESNGNDIILIGD